MRHSRRKFLGLVAGSSLISLAGCAENESLADVLEMSSVFRDIDMVTEENDNEEITRLVVTFEEDPMTTYSDCSYNPALSMVTCDHPSTPANPHGSELRLPEEQNIGLSMTQKDNGVAQGDAVIDGGERVLLTGEYTVHVPADIGDGASLSFDVASDGGGPYIEDGTADLSE